MHFYYDYYDAFYDVLILFILYYIILMGYLDRVFHIEGKLVQVRQF
jgi:hypothetical protein